MQHRTPLNRHPATVPGVFVHAVITARRQCFRADHMGDTTMPYMIEVNDRDHAALRAAVDLLQSKGPKADGLPEDYTADDIDKLRRRINGQTATDLPAPAGELQPMRTGDPNESIRDRPNPPPQNAPAGSLGTTAPSKDGSNRTSAPATGATASTSRASKPGKAKSR